MATPKQQRQLDPQQDRSELVEIGMLVLVLAPVAGAILSGPIAGSTLASLAVLDSILIAFTRFY
jgi:hypothetical protein